MNTKTTLILALVAAAVAGYVFLVDKPWQATEEKKPEPVVKALFDPKPDAPDRVEVQRADGKKLVFAKEQDTWKMLEPFEAPATDYQVKSIVDKVLDVKYTAVYPPKDKERPSNDVAGLNKPTAVVKISKEGKEVANLTIGARLPTGKGNYFQKAGSEDIYESETELTDTFTTKIETYRDKNVLKFTMGDVKRVTVEGDRNFVLVKNNNDWVIESPIRARADNTKAEGVVRPLSNLYVSEFKDDSPISYAPYQLDPPRLKITVETEKTVPPKAKPGDPDTQPADIEPSIEKATHELYVGGPVDISAKQFFARLPSHPWVFTIPEYTFKQFAPELTELQDKDLATLDAAKVKSVRVETPEGATTIARKPEEKTGWAFEDGTPADGAAVNDLIKAVSDLKAVNFVDLATELVPQDWEKPRARIAITQEGSLTPTTVLVGAATTSGKMVYVRNAAEDAVAAVYDDAVAQLVLPPVAYRDRTVLSFERGRANKIEVVRAGGPKVVLTQKNNTWSLVEPIEAAADRDAVRNVLQDVSSLQAKRVAAVGGDKAQFGLDTPAASLAVYVEPLTADPNTKVVGQEAATAPPAVSTRPATATRPAAAATQAAMGNKEPTTRPAKTVEERIKQIEELLEFQKTNPDENPLATQMLKDKLAELQAEAAAAAPAATQAAMANQEPTTRPTKTVAERIKQIEELLEFQKTNPDENPLATQMLKDKLAELQAETQPGGSEAAEASPETTTKPAPAPAVAAETPAPAPAPAEPTVFRLHFAQKDGKTYAWLEGRDMIYEVDERIFKDVTAEMHDPQITKFEVDQVQELALGKGQDCLVFRKTGSDWRYLTDPVLPIDAEKVKGVLNDVREIKTPRFVDYAATDLAKYGLGDDAWQLAVTLDDGKRVEILLADSGPKDDADNSRYAVLKGTNKVFLIKGEQAKKFEHKLEDFEKAATST